VYLFLLPRKNCCGLSGGGKSLALPLRGRAVPWLAALWLLLRLQSSLWVSVAGWAAAIPGRGLPGLQQRGANGLGVRG